MSKVRSASLTIFPLTKLNHFFLALSACFHIAHKVAAFLQPYSRQQLKLEESADRSFQYLVFSALYFICNGSCVILLHFNLNLNFYDD